MAYQGFKHNKWPGEGVNGLINYAVEYEGTLIKIKLKQYNATAATVAAGFHLFTHIAPQ